MRIVLPDALPDPNEARELLPHLLKAAPSLVTWLERSHATRIVADPVHTYCTAWEYWQLLQYGFKPEAGQVHSAGLGPLRAASMVSTDEPVWLVELIHISPARDGAVLIPATELALSTKHSTELLRSAQNLFVGTGFSVSPCDTDHWRITLPRDYTPACASPKLVSMGTVNDWWQQDLAGRPWRRLANELQMVWFDHPVNQARYEQGQLPINSVWLFGGARASQFDVSIASELPSVHVDQRLSHSAQAKDWGTWLQKMNELDAKLFVTLDNQAEIILTGHDRVLTFSTDKRFWMHWLPGTKESWKKWWLSLN